MYKLNNKVKLRLEKSTVLGEWVDVRAVLRIACSNQKMICFKALSLLPSTNIFSKCFAISQHIFFQQIASEEDAKAPNEEVTVLPSDYQFLFNRFSYSNMLTQGHLYFRSWDELQYQVLGSLPEGSSSALADVPPEMMPRHPFDRMGSSNSDDER